MQHAVATVVDFLMYGKKCPDTIQAYIVFSTVTQDDLIALLIVRFKMIFGICSVTM